jgi:hypothetical protein
MTKNIYNVYLENTKMSHLKYCHSPCYGIANISDVVSGMNIQNAIIYFDHDATKVVTKYKKICDWYMPNTTFYFDDIFIYDSNTMHILKHYGIKISITFISILNFENFPWSRYDQSINKMIITKAIARGVSLDTKDNLGYKPLYYAIENNLCQNVKSLIDNNVNIFRIDKANNSALYVKSYTNNNLALISSRYIKNIVSNKYREYLHNFYNFIWCSNNSIQFPINILQKIWKYYCCT